MYQCTFYLNKEIIILENQEIILKYIEDNPGLTQAQITHRLEIPQSTVKYHCLLYTSPSPRDATLSRMPSSA